jgi:hypothetical protein
MKTYWVDVERLVVMDEIAERERLGPFPSRDKAEREGRRQVRRGAVKFEIIEEGRKP